MRILQLGMEKSGNFWVYQILQRIMEQAGIEQKRNIHLDPDFKWISKLAFSTKAQNEKDVLDIEDSGLFYRVSSVLKKPISDFSGFLGNVSHVWSHSSDCTLTPRVVDSFDKVFYVVRDPRDVALSLSEFVLTDYMKKYYPNPWASSDQYLKYNLFSIAARWNNHVVPYIGRYRHEIYFLFYERLVQNFDLELDSILDFLGLALSSNAKKVIVNSTSATVMAKVDPQHVRDPAVYKWRNKFTARENYIIEAIAREGINCAGYELTWHPKKMAAFNEFFVRKWCAAVGGPARFAEKVRRKAFTSFN